MLCTPNLCTPRSKRVLNTVRITPAHTGILSSILNAKAVPNTALAKQYVTEMQTEHIQEEETKLIVYWSTFRDIIRYHCKLGADPQANVDETWVLFPAEFSKMLPYTKLANRMNLTRLWRILYKETKTDVKWKVPVFTPRLAASVWIKSAKIIPTKTTQRSCLT